MRLTVLAVTLGCSISATGMAQETTAAADSADTGTAARAAATDRRAPELSPTSPVAPQVNPLDRYLEAWIRPRDRARQQTSLPTADESWRRLTTVSAGPATRKAPAPTTPATANPYIAAMNAPANQPTARTPPASLTGTPSQAGSPAAPSAAPASLAEPEAPPPPPPVRYQPPPSSDAKYFPQLKRF